MTRKATGAEQVRWNLADLYGGMDDPRIAVDMAGVRHGAQALSRQNKGHIADETLGPRGLARFLVAEEDVLTRLARIQQYASLRFAEDSTDAGAKTLLVKAQELEADVASLFVWADIELCGLEERAFDELASSRELAAYRHWLLHTRQGCEHLLSEKEEALMARRDLSGKLALRKLYSELNSSFEYKMTVDGQRRVLSGSQLEAMRESPDVRLRHRSQDVRLGAFAKNGLMLTGLYNGLLKDHQVECEVRRYQNAMGPRNMLNELSDDIIDMLSEVTSANTSMVERYYRLKARMLGVPRLTLADIYAPVGGAERHYTWAEARSTVLAAYNGFDPRAGKLVGEFFDHGWIHAATDLHKRGGAFCSSADPGLHPYVMLTFSGTARNVETLAHELGHGLHGRLAGERQTILSFHPVMPMAEVASVFGEMLVTQEMLRHMTDPAEKRALYCRKLEGAFAKSQRQNMFHHFELRTHALAPDHQLSKQELDGIYHEELDNMFHGSVTVPRSFDGEWSAIHHIFLYPFYVYAYNFAQCIVVALYQKYLEEGDTFKTFYFDLLASGGNGSPQELLAQAGIDLSDRGFWQRGFDFMRAQWLEPLEDLS